MPPPRGWNGVRWPKKPQKLAISWDGGPEAKFDLRGASRVHSCKRKRFYLRLSRCCSSADTAPRFTLTSPTRVDWEGKPPREWIGKENPHESGLVRKNGQQCYGRRGYARRKTRE
jgi:hypothetical protein